MIALAAIVAVTGATVGLGLYGVRVVRTTSDLFVASRAVTPWWNAAAISGEYLSAASFLGIAGLQMKLGSGALWLPLGFTAGYLALLLFVAAPLRRLGAYTISDFAESRLGSPRLRTLSAAIVLGIGGFYLVPQLKGAGLTLREVTGAPYWVGVLAVGAVVAGNVAAGGMRGITYVQAFQYWLKTFAIALPACLLLLYLGGLPERAALFGHELPRAPAGGLVVELETPTTVTFPAAARYRVDGVPQRARAGEERELPAGTIRLPADTVVPVAEGIDAQRGEQWSRPVSHRGPVSPVFVYSLLVATFLGTMGLPHILVRFYTNPDGPAARRTTVRVLGLLALFYAFPVVYGLLGRALLPELYLTGDTDSVVLRLPEAAWPGSAVSCSARSSRRGPSPRSCRPPPACSSRWPAPCPSTSGAAARARCTSGGGASAWLRWARSSRRSRSRCWPESSTSPCSWAGRSRWPRQLLPAAAAGDLVGGPDRARRWSRLLVVGSLVSSGLIFLGLAIETSSTTVDELLSQPAVISVPLAFATMVLVSLVGRGRAPAGADAQLLALHAPEGLGLER